MTTSNSWISRVGVAAIAAGIALSAGPARAEGPVTSRPKGMIGGGLLGAEVGLIITAIVGPKTWWPYVLFGAVGAGAGVAGGFAVEEASAGANGEDTPEPSLYMLAGGMALVVPTLVAVLNATAYEPEEEEIQEDDEELPGDEVPGVDVEGGAEVETGLLRIDTFHKTRVRVGVPAVSVGPRFTPMEVATYGVAQATEVRMPVISGSF